MCLGSLRSTSGFASWITPLPTYPFSSHPATSSSSFIPLLKFWLQISTYPPSVWLICHLSESLSNKAVLFGWGAAGNVPDSQKLRKSQAGWW